MTLRSQLHSPSHAIILVLLKQKACKQDGWVCDGSTSSFHGCYCKCVTLMRSFHLKWACQCQWLLSFTVLLFIKLVRFSEQNQTYDLLQRLPVIWKYIQISRQTAIHLVCHMLLSCRSGRTDEDRTHFWKLGTSLHVRVETVLYQLYCGHRNTFHPSIKHVKKNCRYVKWIEIKRLTQYKLLNEDKQNKTSGLKSKPLLL